jgi:sugar O-acyltransferase (sialic acid O-acetyltransferase NeuD family)
MQNFILGAGGFAREVDWLIEEIYRDYKADYRPQNFIAPDLDEQVSRTINGKVVLSESEFFQKYGSDAVNCFMGVGNPETKEKILHKVQQNAKRAKFPNLIHPNVLHDKRNTKISFGVGNIICSNAVITTDVIIGDFVTINLACTVGHDCSIGNFATLSPGVHLSGRVRLGDRVFIGTGAQIIERIHVTSNTIIGAGATVVRNIEIAGSYVGTPAKRKRG